MLSSNYRQGREQLKALTVHLGSKTKAAIIKSNGKTFDEFLNELEVNLGKALKNSDGRK